jgi:hypothetical protein
MGKRYSDVHYKRAMNQNHHLLLYSGNPCAGLASVHSCLFRGLYFRVPHVLSDLFYYYYA